MRDTVDHEEVSCCSCFCQSDPNDNGTSSIESRTFLFGLHCTVDDHCAPNMSSLKTHLDQCVAKPRMNIMCGHCGNVYQDMCTLAHHLNVRKMHMELSKIEGYDMRTFRPSQYFLPHSTDREQQCLLTSPLSPSTDSSLTGYATSVSVVTISSTNTNKGTDNRDMPWTQDVDSYFLNTPQSTAGLDPQTSQSCRYRPCTWIKLQQIKKSETY